MTTTEKHEDIAELMRRIKQGLWTPITESPWYDFPGKEGFTSDAAIRVIEDPSTKQVISVEGGWVVHLFGHAAGAAWSAETLQLVAVKRLSISPLELLTTTAAIELLGKIGRIPDERKVVLRCDNTSACNVANTLAAYSPTMRFALKTLERVCERHSVTVRLIYIASRENIVADSISRNKWAEARSRVAELGWQFEKHDMTACMKEWEEQLQMLNQAHKVLEYLSQEHHGCEEAEKRIESIDIGISKN